MGTFKAFIEGKGIKEGQLLAASNRVEAIGNEGRWLRSKRVAKRKSKELAEKKYAELDLKKPNTGRGLSKNQLTAALNDKPLSKKVRAKALRAVNAVLTSKKQAAADMKALFEGVAARAGKKPKEAEKKA